MEEKLIELGTLVLDIYDFKIATSNVWRSRTSLRDKFKQLVIRKECLLKELSKKSKEKK